MSKKLEEKRLRREAEERRKGEMKRARRNRNLITIAVALVVTLLVGFLIINERKAEEEKFSSVSAVEAGCGDVETFELLGADHVDEGTQIEYNSTPPTSGPHYAQPSPTGFFTDPVEPERLVHNEEHGQIVFWYDSAAPQATIDSIEAYVEASPGALVATPYEQVPSGSEFSMTAWGASQSCVEVSQEVLDNFRARFQGQGPEKLTPPFNP